MRIAQITDSHVVTGRLWRERIDTVATFERALAALPGWAPDLVIHTGDLVDEGGPQDYAFAARRLDALGLPLRVLPGNHDRRELMRAAFPDHGWADGEFLNWVAERDGLRLIGLDSVAPGQTGGRVCRARLDWLDDALGPGPSILFMHHPPCKMGLPFMDGFGFEGGEALAEVIAGRGVLRIVCGHVHADVERGFADTIVSAASAINMQLSPDLPSHEEIRTGKPAGFTIDPLRLRLMDWRDGVLSVKSVFAEPTEGPFPFSG